MKPVVSEKPEVLFARTPNHQHIIVQPWAVQLFSYWYFQLTLLERNGFAPQGFSAEPGRVWLEETTLVQQKRKKQLVPFFSEHFQTVV